MIELTLKDELEKSLELPVVFEQINEPMYVLIEKTGSSKRNQITSATFAFQSYSSQSMYQAAELNISVKMSVEKLEEKNKIISASLVSDYNFTDTETKYYRYQAVYEIKYYERID